MNKITVTILASIVAIVLSSNTFASDDKHQWKRGHHQVHQNYRGHQYRRDNYQHHQYQRKHHHERHIRHYRVQRNRIFESILLGLPGLLLFHSH